MTDKSRQFQIFLASFMTLIAAGMGFAIRAAILSDWEAQFGFTKAELGSITGGGLVGFGVTIIVCSIFADRLGYRAILLGAFALHILSAAVTLAATPVYESYGKDATFQCLYWGMFLFALGNGLCEAAINPLVATLYPNQKTHYLNILHAGWPGGLILGAVLGYMFAGQDAAVQHLRWEIPMSFFLLPALYYGFVTVKEKFPISEARAAGVTFGEMLAEFAQPVLLLLFLLHAMVGYVELGTDSWITDIMKATIRGNALLLFIYTSGIMFVLRFFAGPIVERINPLGLLFISACLGAIGLFALGSSTTGIAILVSATVYGLGKTFLWPTMLGVVGERFPRGGALTMGTIGGIGMLSAGLLGSPGIGYKQDFYATQYLREQSPTVYQEFKSDDTKSFLMFPPIAGLDGKKVQALVERENEVATLTAKGQPVPSSVQLTEADQQVLDARIFGGRMALKWTAVVPLAMAVGYLILLIYFRAKGGYKQVHIGSPTRALGEPIPTVER
jgi:MFS family permease